LCFGCSVTAQIAPNFSSVRINQRAINSFNSARLEVYNDSSYCYNCATNLYPATIWLEDKVRTTNDVMTIKNAYAGTVINATSPFGIVYHATVTHDNAVPVQVDNTLSKYDQNPIFQISGAGVILTNQFTTAPTDSVNGKGWLLIRILTPTTNNFYKIKLFQ
jgi:hypothetical protein